MEQKKKLQKLSASGLSYLLSIADLDYESAKNIIESMSPLKYKERTCDFKDILVTGKINRIELVYLMIKGLGKEHLGSPGPNLFCGELREWMTHKNSFFRRAGFLGTLINNPEGEVDSKGLISIFLYAQEFPEEDFAKEAWARATKVSEKGLLEECEKIYNYLHDDSAITDKGKELAQFLIEKMRSKAADSFKDLYISGEE